MGPDYRVISGSSGQRGWLLVRRLYLRFVGQNSNSGVARVHSSELQITIYCNQANKLTSLYDNKSRLRSVTVSSYRGSRVG